MSVSNSEFYARMLAIQNSPSYDRWAVRKIIQALYLSRGARRVKEAYHRGRLGKPVRLP
jgi:hypothetical protein